MKKFISTLLLSAVMLMAFTGLSMAQTGTSTQESGGGGTSTTSTQPGGGDGGTTSTSDDQGDPPLAENIPT